MISAKNVYQRQKRVTKLKRRAIQRKNMFTDKAAVLYKITLTNSKTCHQTPQRIIKRKQVIFSEKTINMLFEAKKKI